MSFTQVFGGTVIYPSEVSYLSLSLAAGSETLTWPTENSIGTNVVAQIIDVSTSGVAPNSIIMPDARQVSVGQTALFNNLGPDTITVKDSSGATLISLAAGEQWQLYLYDNATAAGSWRNFRYGASIAQAQASTLAGLGLVAVGSTLAQSSEVNAYNTNYTVGAPDRSKTLIWNGGVGSFSLPDASTVGNNFFFNVRNDGSGDLTVTPAGADTINGAATLIMNPEDSAVIVTDGTRWYTIGLGQQPVFVFDYTTISLAGLSGTYTLSGSQLNRIVYKFTGLVVGDIDIVVPKTVQQYWVDNSTTGGTYVLNIKTSTQSPALNVPRNQRGIYYCDGSNVIKADTTSGVSTPISIADGGTNASTAAQALVNLGGTTVGRALFTAASAALARSAMSAAASGANSDITSLTGLTTPLSIAQGGTGSSTSNNNAVAFYGSTGLLSSSTNFVYTSNRLGVGTSTPTTALEVISGSVVFRSSNTPSTANTTRLYLGAYSGNPLTAMVGTSDASTNVLNIGGGTGGGEPASSILFTTGTAGSLGTGTARMALRSDNHLQLYAGNNLMAGTTASYSTISAITSSTTNDAFNPAIAVTNTSASMSMGGYIGSRSVASNQRQGLYISSQQMLTLWGDATGDGGGVLDVVSGTSPSASADTASLFRIKADGNVGIGEADPSMPLYIKRTLNTVYSGGTGFTGNMAYLFNPSTAAGSVYAGLTFTVTGSTATSASGTINLVHTGDGSGAFTFQTRNAGTFAERVRITSEGNLLVGPAGAANVRAQFYADNPTRGILGLFANPATASRTGAQIQFTQSGVADWTIGEPAEDGSFAFWYGRNPSSDGSERMRIDTAGRVLIGTTASKQLAYTVDPRLQVEEASSTHGASIGTNVNTTSGSYLSFSKSRAGALGGVTAVVDNDNLGGLRFQGANGTGFAVGAEILSLVDGTPSATSMPADLDFRTSPNGTVTPLSRMTVSAEGLITMRAPTAGTTTTLSISAATGNTLVSMSDGTVSGFITSSTGLNFGTSSAHSTRLHTNGVARLSITSAGNASIAAPSSGVAATITGAAAAASTLDVVGNATTTRLARFNGATGASCTVQFMENSAAKYSVGYSAGAASFIIYDDVALATRLYLNSAGNFSISAPSSGTALTVSGDIACTNISGNGAGLTALNAGNITSGVLSVAQGGNGTATPSLQAGTNITISGTWPNQTITASGGSSGITIGTTGISGGTTGRVLYNNGGFVGEYSTIPVGQGGTGSNTFTVGALLKYTNTPSSQIVSATAGTDYVVPGSANTFTAAQTFRATNAVRVENGSTQDAVVLAGRAGGATSLAVTLTPATLTASRTLTLPDLSGTVALTNAAQIFTAQQSFDSGNFILRGATSGTIAVNPPAVAGTNTITLPAASGTVALTSSAQTFTANQSFNSGNLLLNGATSGATTINASAIAGATTITLPAVTDTVAVVGTAQTFTAAQTFRAANGVRSEAAATQDAVVVAGRAGGSNSFAATITPAVLTASRTFTLPDVGGTFGLIDAAQTFTAAKSFGSGNLLLNGSTSGSITLNAAAVAGSNTVTLPAATGTVALLNLAQTFSAVQSFGSGNLRLNGSGSGTTTLNASAAAGTTTLTLPAVTDTIATIGTSQVFTAAQTFRAGSAIRSEASAGQDAIVLAGRAGGTNSFAATLTPTTLTASRTITLPDASGTISFTDASQTFTSSQTFRAGNAIRSEAAATQDAVVIAGRAGGSSSFAATITPAALTASRTVTIPDASFTVGYIDVPQNAQNGAYTFAASDVGKHVYSANTGAQTITVPTGAGIPVGTAITVVNNGTTAITFTTTGTTVYKAGTSAAWASGGTLAVRGMCTWLKVATDTWFVNGTGLS